MAPREDQDARVHDDDAEKIAAEKEDDVDVENYDDLIGGESDNAEVSATAAALRQHRNAQDAADKDELEPMFDELAPATLANESDATKSKATGDDDDASPRSRRKGEAGEADPGGEHWGEGWSMPIYTVPPPTTPGSPQPPPWLKPK